MKKQTYSIKEASEKLQLENHTLRYYEDELELSIPRNSMGHRYYRQYDMKVFRDIIALKQQGLQLRAIKSAIKEWYDPDGADDWEEANEAYMEATATIDLPVKGASSQEGGPVFDITDTSNTKVEQFRLMMKETFVQAIYENEDELKAELNHHIKYKIEEDLKEEIEKIETMYEEKNKERYRRLDETMREMQKIREQLADITESKTEKKSLFGKLFAKKSITVYQDES